MGAHPTTGRNRHAGRRLRGVDRLLVNVNLLPYPAENSLMSPLSRFRRAPFAALTFVLIVAASGCSKKVVPTGPTTPPPRAYRMGFSAIPPKADFSLLIASLEMWRTRSDAAIMHISPPWDTLLAGYSSDSAVIKLHLDLANYFKGSGRTLVVMIDATDGLNRAADAPELVAKGRSLTEPAVRQVFRDFAMAVDSVLQPAYLGLTAETNLIRAAAPPALYAAVKQNANDAATAVRALNPTVKLFVSVQVETAWGAFTGGPFVGVAQDLTDFPFMQTMGLSSYPYLGGFVEPEEVPIDYYSRVLQGSGLPGMVVEGGWTSASLPSAGIVSSPAKQARWIRRHIQLLDRANAIFVFQLTFTDLDLTGVPLPPGSILPIFASCGLVDATLAPKPALAPWDSAFARPRM